MCCSRLGCGNMHARKPRATSSSLVCVRTGTARHRMFQGPPARQDIHTVEVPDRLSRLLARLRGTASESGPQIIDRPPEESLGNGVDVSLMMSKAFLLFGGYVSQPPESLQLTVVILISQCLAIVPAGSRWRWRWRWRGQAWRAWAARQPTLDGIRSLWRKLSWARPM